MAGQRGGSCGRRRRRAFMSSASLEILVALAMIGTISLARWVLVLGHALLSSTVCVGAVDGGLLPVVCSVWSQEGSQHYHYQLAE